MTQAIPDAKYAIPRNPMFESMTMEEVLRGGIWRVGDRRMGHRVKAWRGATTPGAHEVSGSLIWYNTGMIFFPDAEMPADNIVELALKEPPMILMDEAPSLREYLGFLKGQPAGGDTLSKLERTVKAPQFFKLLHSSETFAVPYLELVEAEDRTFKKLLGSVRHSILTCEGADGSRRSFTFEDLTMERIGTAAFQMRENRLKTEILRVIELVKWDLVDLAKLDKEEEKLRADYGAEWTRHAPEIITKLIQARDQQLEEAGYSLAKFGTTELPLDRRLAAAVLERFGKTTQLFLQIPAQLNEWLESLQSTAEGKAAASSK